MIQKHSPLPFKQSGNYITASDGITSAQIGKTFEAETIPYVANAEFIVRACNAHYDLLAACEAAHVQMIALGNLLNWEDVPQEYADAINKIREARARAGGAEGE